MAQTGRCLGHMNGTTLLPAKQASKPSPKLIIVVTHTHGNNGNGGLEIAMFQLVADQGHSDGPIGCISPCENGPNWTVSWPYEWYYSAACQASLKTLSKAHHCCHTYPWQQWQWRA